MIIQDIYVRQKDWKKKNEPCGLSQGLPGVFDEKAENTFETLKKVPGVNEVQQLKGSVGPVSFTIGFKVEGAYDPNLVQNAITSCGSDILTEEDYKTKTRIENDC